MVIKQLDDETINQIAAGEVIERPSSAVKELIENSMDAGADKIDVFIADGGRKKIVVEDNGMGMGREDAEKAILRHTTSKIKDYRDLFNIMTMGFRGEALSSIASVSEMSIITKSTSENTGVRIDVCGGDIKNTKTVACNNGTKMIINDLFFNVPARKKFLKGRGYEQKLIVDILSRYALIHTDKAFSLRNEEGILIEKPVTASIKENMASVYGLDVARESFEINSSLVKGYVAKPTVNRSTRDYISVYVNGRYVKSKIVEDAVMDAMKTLIFHGRYPIAVLSISLNPDNIDVNVHPSKKIIKFNDEEGIYKGIYEAVKEAVDNSDLFTVSKSKPLQERLSNEESGIGSWDVTAGDDCSFNTLKPKENKYFRRQADSQSYLLNEDANDYRPEDNKKGFDFNIVGQIHRTYIVIETEEGYSLIDQHAAEERINYERFKKQFDKGDVKKQSLLNGFVIELNIKDFSVIMENSELLHEFGFEFEEFGNNSIILREIPASLSLENENFRDTILTLAGKLSEKRNMTIDEKKEESIVYMACRLSIKAGKLLNQKEMKDLVVRLMGTGNKYTCPHGRPTMLRYPLSKIEKDFKRVE